MTHATDHLDPSEARRRAYREQQAEIYQQLQTLLEPGENLLGFTRGRIAGGFQGKLFIGIESFFVPYVNVGLTDKRLILQHLTRELDKPSRNQPHSFPLPEVINIAFTEADAFHEIDELGRLSVQLLDEQSCRLRLDGAGACDDAKELVEVFNSLSTRHHTPQSPTQQLCKECQKVIDQPVKFCPYCGIKLAVEQPLQEAATSEETPDKPSETFTEAVVETAIEVAVVVETVAEVVVEVVEAIVEVPVEVPETVAETPEVVVETAQAEEAPHAEETPQAAESAPNPNDITSWDAYAQKVIAEQNALRPEGGERTI